MKRNLNVVLKKETWPKKMPPSSLQKIQGSQSIDVAAFLLTIGYCTVPSHAARHSINTLWAWIRYFGALSPDSEFRLSDDFSELDPHQKTILSDDFGMGMSMHLLATSLDLKMFCDGKYFIDRLSTRVRCQIDASGAKKGPKKSPDFVGVDGTGKWHVIECKGTQSGSGYGNKQLKGGVAQKNAIRFAGSLRGESLVTGFEIAHGDPTTSSRFIIRDPEPEVPPLEVASDEYGKSIETIARGKIARCLTLAGAPNLSRFVAAPFGDDPSNRPDMEALQRGNERAQRFREYGMQDWTRMQAKGGFRGREATLELPFQVDTGKGQFSRVHVRSEISSDEIDYWRDRSLEDLPQADELENNSVSAAEGALTFQSDGSGGELNDGKLFRSRIEFLK